MDLFFTRLTASLDVGNWSNSGAPYLCINVSRLKHLFFYTTANLQKSARLARDITSRGLSEHYNIVCKDHETIPFG